MIAYYKRLMIWDWILEKAKHPQATKLPIWLRHVYTILFPLLSFYWYMNKSNGYQPMTNVWLIHGKKYSDNIFRHFTIGSDNTFKIIHSDDVVTIQVIDKVK